MSNPITPVRNPLIYKFAPTDRDSAVVTIDKVEVKNILLNNDKSDCDHKLLELSWAMLAKSIAKDVYGKDIDTAKTDLATKLKDGNYPYSTPAEILKGQPMSLGQKVLSTLFLKFQYSQYYSYIKFLTTGNAFVKWGSFPDNLPVKLSKDFKSALGQPSAPVEQQAVAKAAKPAKQPRAPKANREQAAAPAPAAPAPAPEAPAPKKQSCPPGSMRDLSGDCIDTTGTGQ